MEFLGDAVLGLAIARRLFGDYGDLSEGRLSRMKAALVCEDTLAVVAEKIGLGDDIRLGRGEQASGGRSKPSILSDALEAVFAAVYLDAGYRTAEALINRLFDDLIHEGTSSLHADARSCRDRQVQLATHHEGREPPKLQRCAVQTQALGRSGRFPRPLLPRLLLPPCRLSLRHAAGILREPTPIDEPVASVEPGW
jgi:dsRNA-specific ribonuclease